MALSPATIPAMCTGVPAAFHPPRSVPNIALAQTGCDVGLGRGLFIYVTALIHDKENTLMGGERQEICLRSHVWERWPRRVNTNEGEKLMLLPPLPLSLCVIYSHFIQWAHNPYGVSARPGKCRARAATDEYGCPLCLFRCLDAGKSNRFVMLFVTVRVNL